MAEKIPFFEQRIKASSESSGALSNVQASTDAAIAPIRAGVGVVNTLVQAGTKIGFAMKEKQEKLRHESEMSDYEVGLNNLDAKIEEATTDAMFRDDNPVSYDNVFDEVVAPLIKEHGELLGQTEYSDLSRSEINQRWAKDASSIRQGQIITRERREREDRVGIIKQDMWNLLGAGKEEEAEEKYEFLKGISGEAKANEWRSHGLYNVYNADMEAQKRLYSEGLISADEYVEWLDEKNTTIESDDRLSLNHKKSLSSVASARGSNIFHAEGTASASAMKKWTKAQEEGKLTPAQDTILQKAIPEPMYDDLMDSMKQSLAGKATSNAKVRKQLEIIDARNRGKKSITEAFREIRASGGEFAFQSLLWLQDEVIEDVESGKEIEAYEILRRDKKVKTTGKMGDFISTMMPLLSLDMSAPEVNNLMRNATIALRLNPEMTDDEWATARDDILRGKAREVIQGLMPALPIGLIPRSKRKSAEKQEESAQEFGSEASAIKAGLPKGTIVIINGRRARID